jgi:S1-C subfamily serine protease
LIYPIRSASAQQTTEWRCVQVNGHENLNIRSGPGLDYEVLTQAGPEQKIEANMVGLQATTSYNWVPVRSGGVEGWVITARLSPCMPVGELTLAGVNHDGQLDHAEVDTIARSVVLLENIQGGEQVSTGTGTIITPDGLILTNAHVVEDADEIRVDMLDNINDPPTARYIAQVISFNRDIDAALLAIRADANYQPVSPASLNLPYVPASVNATDVYRGDSVYIFGYPGIGNDYLVMTGGTIVSVENGDLRGTRLPVWYRTDAELAPGNSGGLVVNSNGEMIGIPTTVRSESATGGRLGGIRPAQVALATVLNDSGDVTGPLPQVSVTLRQVHSEFDQTVNGQMGMMIHVSFVLNGWKGEDADVIAYFFYDDTLSTPVTNPSAPNAYRDPRSGVVQTSASIEPCCDETLYTDLDLFIPYSVLGITQPGQHPLKYRLEVRDANHQWEQTLSWEYLSYNVSG